MDKIRFDVVNDLAILTFTNPSARNCLSADVLAEIGEILRRSDADESLSKLIFTGEGEVFASGADLTEIAEFEISGATAFALAGQEIMSAVAGSRLKTIAAVNGFCFGGALDLALACDARIASPSAVFCHPGASLGIVTGWGGTQRLPRKIGQARALEMFFTARRVDAYEAKAIGLVDLIADDIMAAAISYPNI